MRSTCFGKSRIYQIRLTSGFNFQRFFVRCFGWNHLFRKNSLLWALFVLAVCLLFFIRFRTSRVWIFSCRLLPFSIAFSASCFCFTFLFCAFFSIMLIAAGLGDLAFTSLVSWAFANESIKKNTKAKKQAALRIFKPLIMMHKREGRYFVLL